MEKVILGNLVIAEGEEKIIEGKELVLDGRVHAKGTLILRRCLIRHEGGSIEVSGELEMEHCKCQDVSEGFIKILPNAKAVLARSRLYPVLNAHNIICESMTAGLTCLDDCSFTGTDSTLPDGVTHRYSCINMPNAIIANCTFVSVAGDIHGRIFNHDKFENCHRIVADIAEKNAVEFCSFQNCGTVSVDEGMIKENTFDGIDTLYASRANIENCQFSNITCAMDCFISPEDSNITGCTFENIRLENESYIANVAGDVFVEHCTFKDIYTSREDRELFLCEETTGVIFKKTKRFDIVDDATCTGLEDVKVLST